MYLSWRNLRARVVVPCRFFTALFALFAVFALFAPFALAAPPAMSAQKLQEKMSTEEFRSAGLHRLSPEELGYLNQWLFPAAPEKTASFGQEQLPSAVPAPVTSNPEIATRIAGKFTGWDGRTVFRLENGQVWQQRQAGTYSYRAESPEVTIRRGNFGYYLKVVTTRRQIPVKRLK